MKKLIGLLLILGTSQVLSAELCDYGAEFQTIEELTDVLKAPSIHARFELNKDCDFSVLTTTYTNSDKSLKDFMKQLTDPAVNKASANSNVKSYSVKKNSDGSFEQTVVASKSFVTATIVNTCRYTTNTNQEMIYECNLKNGDGFLKNNKTVITCTNSNDNQKKCTFQTNGRAIGQFMKGACTLAAGGAAETVNGIQRLMEYMTFGKVNPKKWEKPGKLFYDSVSNYDSNRLKTKNFVYQQQIQ